MADQLREKIARLVASCGIPEYAKDEIWAEDLPMWIRRRERTDRPSQDNPFGLADAILALFREEGVDLEGWRRPRVRICQSKDEVCDGLMGKNCTCPYEKVVVAAIVDIAQRAFDHTGEPHELHVAEEVHDGVPYIRINTDPCSMLLPLSAAKIVFGSLISSEPRP